MSFCSMHISLTGQNQAYAVGSIQIDRNLLCGNTEETANILIVVHNAKLVSLQYQSLIRIRYLFIIVNKEYLYHI